MGYLRVVVVSKDGRKKNRGLVDVLLFDSRSRSDYCCYFSEISLKYSAPLMRLKDPWEKNGVFLT